MHILFVTTSSNAVRKTLQDLIGVNLSVIDCEAYACRSVGEMKASLLSEMETFIVNNGDIDVLITYRCPFIIPKRIYSFAKQGAFNIHPSLLPKYQGMNPWEQVFKNNEHVSGVTIHHLSEEPDCGEIVLQNTFYIESGESLNKARSKADILAAKMVRCLFGGEMTNYGMIGLDLEKGEK